MRTPPFAAGLHAAVIVPPTKSCPLWVVQYVLVQNWQIVWNSSRCSDQPEEPTAGGLEGYKKEDPKHLQRFLSRQKKEDLSE